MANRGRAGDDAGPGHGGLCADRPRPGKRDKIGGHWWSEAAESAFFEVLAGSGNVRAAAEAIGFSATAVYALRRTRPDFAEKWAAALAVPRAGAPGRIVRDCGNGRARRIRCMTQWSEEVEAHFLDLLAATCNVRLSAEETGVGSSSVYRQRRRRADFAAKWEGALEQGYARIEMGLVRNAIEALEAEFDPDRPAPRMSIDQAIKVLQAHRAAVKGVGKVSGWKAPRRSVEYHRESILRKIAAIKAAREPGSGGPGAVRNPAGGLERSAS